MYLWDTSKNYNYDDAVVGVFPIYLGKHYGQTRTVTVAPFLKKQDDVGTTKSMDVYLSAKPPAYVGTYPGVATADSLYFEPPYDVVNFAITTTTMTAYAAKTLRLVAPHALGVMYLTLIANDDNTTGAGSDLVGFQGFQKAWVNARSDLP